MRKKPIKNDYGLFTFAAMIVALGGPNMKKLYGFKSTEECMIDTLLMLLLSREFE